jgi:hypothetical protein
MLKSENNAPSKISTYTSERQHQVVQNPAIRWRITSGEEVLARGESLAALRRPSHLHFALQQVAPATVGSHALLIAFPKVKCTQTAFHYKADLPLSSEANWHLVAILQGCVCGRDAILFPPDMPQEFMWAQKYIPWDLNPKQFPVPPSY